MTEIVVTSLSLFFVSLLVAAIMKAVYNFWRK